MREDQSNGTSNLVSEAAIVSRPPKRYKTSLYINTNISYINAVYISTEVELGGRACLDQENTGARIDQFAREYRARGSCPHDNKVISVFLGEGSIIGIRDVEEDGSREEGGEGEEESKHEEGEQTAAAEETTLLPPLYRTHGQDLLAKNSCGEV